MTAFLGGLVYCVSCVYLFLLIELKPTSVGDDELAAPRTLPYLEINVGQKSRCKKALVCLKGCLLLAVIVVDLIKDITSTSELYNARKVCSCQ